jgi:hypothetical protein
MTWEFFWFVLPRIWLATVMFVAAYLLATREIEHD